MTVERLDPFDGEYYDYCDTFKDDKCVTCGQDMSRGVGTIKCRGHK